MLNSAYVGVALVSLWGSDFIVSQVTNNLLTAFYICLSPGLVADEDLTIVTEYSLYDSDVD